MKFVFLMDPLHTVIMEKDTSFILMLGAHRAGHDVYFLPDGGITLVDNQLKFHVKKVIPQQDAVQPFQEEGDLVLAQDDIDVVFVRSDPPFDQQYLQNTWLLDLLPDHVLVINKPSGIRAANEKIWATRFPSLIPPTLIGCNKDDIIQFLNTHKNIVAKPTDGHGGQSVFHVKKGDRNALVTLETLSKNWQREIVLQKYIPEAEKGDKRILLLNGEPLGAVLRMHTEDDHRNNFFAGGKPLPAGITARNQEIIEELKPYLIAEGLYFVGIDILGDYLVEVNVTSPTGLQEAGRLSERALEKDVIAFAEKLVQQQKSVTS